jgi:hypothetical protein
MRNLRQICEMNNPSLIRVALDSLLGKLASLQQTNAGNDYPSWAVQLVSMVVTWLPIQHRYLVVSASLEDLESSRLNRDKSISTPKQELILTIVEGVLTTGESLIGLNVMDVLNILIEKIAVQLSTRPNTKMDVVQKLVNCIVGLAGHVYYTDQIRDMCTSIMEWSGPLIKALNPTSGKDSPANEEDDVLFVKSAIIWSLRMLKGILIEGGSSVTLEEVWTSTEGGIAGRETDVRMEYVDALITHIRCEPGEEEQETLISPARFLSMMHVSIFNALKRDDNSPQDYWTLWVLMCVLLEKFEAKEVVKALPMMWRIIDSSNQKATRERQLSIEAIFLGYLEVVANTFTIPDLETSISKVIPI